MLLLRSRNPRHGPSVHLPIDSFIPQTLTEHLLRAVPMCGLGDAEMDKPPSSPLCKRTFTWTVATESDHGFYRTKPEIEGANPASGGGVEAGFP